MNTDLPAHGTCDIGRATLPRLHREGVGIVIGRFQVADLHEGHHAVFSEASKHTKLLVFVGISPGQLVTPSDPLDYPARERMIKEAYPDATVMPLLDEPTDEGWSDTLDNTVHALYPLDKATLYYGRTSFSDTYSGKHRTAEVGEEHKISGTELRDIDGSTVGNQPAWRRGVIYASQNRYGSIYPCVDVVVYRERDPKHQSPGIEVLVGRRHNEGGKFRFPGGHVNPGDTGAEAAARRELNEETGLECGDLEYIGNYRVKSWRDTKRGGVIFTTLFAAPYTFGGPKANDDLDELFWIQLSDLSKKLWSDSHALLASEVIDHLA